MYLNCDLDTHLYVLRSATDSPLFLCPQDPMNPNETVIVIRSLVPGGVAQVDGQLIPGDRLLSVNDTSLENASLDQAVQALKGAPRGVVRIGVAKPLPIPDSVSQVSEPPREYYSDVVEGPPVPEDDEAEEGGSGTDSPTQTVLMKSESF